MHILHLSIDITGAQEVTRGSAAVRMLAFQGRCEGDWFTGEILPGGVDTQVVGDDGRGTLSARYMLSGVDREGRPCRMFIENNAALGQGRTSPRIFTDSPALKWLETAKLWGELRAENGVTIDIFAEQSGK